MNAPKKNDINFFIWVIYKHPSDYPDKFVCRIWNLDKPTDKIWLADTLEGIHRIIPDNMVKLDRHVDDDPVVVETWI